MYAHKAAGLLTKSFPHTVELRIFPFCLIDNLQKPKFNCVQTPGSITIVIIDDHVTFRNGLREVLISAGFNVKAMAGNGADAIVIAKQHQPDIIFVDIRMPGMSGIELCRELHALFPDMGKIAITYHDTYDPDIYAMSLAGASGFLSKQSDVDEIIRCVNTVYNGGIHADENCKHALRDRITEDIQKHGLTEKELQLFHLIGEEKTNKQIGAIMHQSENTIEKWRTKLYDKCDVKGLVGLIKLGMKWGVIKCE